MFYIKWRKSEKQGTRSTEEVDNQQDYDEKHNTHKYGKL